MPSMSTDDKLSEEDDEMDDEESTEGSDASSQESSSPDGTQETASESEAASSSSSSHGVMADCAITPRAQSIEQRIHASESVRNMPHDEAIELDSGMEEQRVTPIKEDRRVYSHSHNASAQKLGSVPSLSFKMVHNAPHDEAMVLEDDEVMNTPPPSKVGKTSNSCIGMDSSLEDMNHSHNGTALRDARLIENDLHDEEVHLDGEYMKTPPEQFLMSSSRHHHIQNERSATRNPTLLQNTSHDEAISVNDTEEHRTPTPPELLLSDRQLKSSDTSQVIPGVGHTIRSEGSRSHGLRDRGRSDRSSSTSSSSSSTTSSESSHPAGDASAGMQDHASRNYKSHSGDVNRKQTSPVVDETASSKAGVATPSYDPKEYLNLNVSREVKDLFLTITNFQPTIVELQAKLIPFLPDYIPAVGDIDTFCKIPRPDEKPDNLGLTVVDEPCANQSNPAVIDISLTYQIKQHVRPSFVDSIEDAQNKPSAIQRWIDDIRSIHSKNPPPTVAYSKAMPDIEKLMQAWPPEIEELLSNGEVLPTAELDVDLVQYIKILCAFLDIPTYTNLVESLHVMFTLYHEFKNNQHFHQRAAI